MWSPILHTHINSTTLKPSYYYVKRLDIQGYIKRTVYIPFVGKNNLRIYIRN